MNIIIFNFDLYFVWTTSKYKNGQTFRFANWARNKGTLFTFCIAPGGFIMRNRVDVMLNFTSYLY